MLRFLPLKSSSGPLPSLGTKFLWLAQASIIVPSTLMLVGDEALPCGQMQHAVEELTRKVRIDQAIADLQAASASDELLLRRLKKRKLALRDRIDQIERLLEPDELA